MKSSRVPRPRPGLGSVTLAALLCLPVLAPGLAVPAAAKQDADCLEGPPRHGPKGGFSDEHVVPGDYNLAGRVAQPLQGGPYEIVGPLFTKINVGGPHRDGSDRLEATSDLGVVNNHLAIYLPGRHGQILEGCRFPTIFVDSLYLFNYGNRESFENPRDHFGMFLKPRLVDNLVPHGYALVFTSPRGLGGNDGCTDVWGPKERADLVKKMDWIVSQSWSDGAIGMFGLSGPGISAWLGASTGHHALKTIVPLNAVADFERSFSRRGSVGFPVLGSLIGYFFVNSLANAIADVDTTNPAGNVEELPHKLRRIVHRGVCPDIAEHAIAEVVAILNGGRDLVTGERHVHWVERDFRPRITENYRGSILVINGLQDTLVPPNNMYPWLGTLEAHGIPVKHILGQWGHGYADAHAPQDPLSRWDIGEILLRWFEYWLKGNETRKLGPVAQVQDSSLRWRSEPAGQAWPPEDAVERRLYLTLGSASGEPRAEVAPRGRLADAPGPTTSRMVLPGVADHVPLVPDENAGVAHTVCWAQLGPTGPVLQELLDAPPCPLSAQFPFDKLSGTVDNPCAPCPTFDLGPLEEELRFAGIPTLDLRVTPTGPVGHLAAHLYAVPPDDASLVAPRACTAPTAGRYSLGYARADLRYARPDEAPATPLRLQHGGVNTGVPVLRPLQPIDVRLEFEPLDAVVPAGWTLRLVVHQGGGGWNYPTPSAPLLLDTDDPSALLTLATFQRGEDAFFRAPGHAAPAPHACTAPDIALVGAPAVGAIMPSL